MKLNHVMLVRSCGMKVGFGRPRCHRVDLVPPLTHSTAFE